MKHQNPTPRETLLVLFWWLQPLITILSGEPGPDEKPYFRMTRNRWIVIYVAVLLASLALTLLLSRHWATWVLLPYAWMLTTGHMRGGQTTILHLSAHATFHPNRKLGVFLAEFFGVLFWLDPYDSYRIPHMKEHHAHLTHGELDSDSRLFRSLGFRPGRPIREYKFWLFRLMISPSYHARTLWPRFKKNAVEGPFF